MTEKFDTFPETPPPLDATKGSSDDDDAFADAPTILETDQVSDEGEDTFAQASTLLDTEKASSHDDDELVGQTLNHFEVLSTLGSGGMGHVYRARDLSLDRIVALKVLPSDMTRPDLLERFKREARAQARLSHPNVVPIYFIGEDRGYHFFAMELVEGNSLDKIVSSPEELSWEVALDYMSQVVGGLRQAHQRELIHRDLKPANLLRGGDGTIKIADFGLAKPIEEGAGELTKEGAFLGTPAYVAPEQAQADGVDHRADMYALGATFFHLLARKPVFEASTPMAIAIKHVTEAPPALHEVAPVPVEFGKLISRLLAKNPDHRFDDYDALQEAIDRLRPIKAPNAGFLVRAAAWGVDVLAVTLVATLTYEPALYVLYPAYFLAAWTLDKPTLGSWLFRLRLKKEDGSSLQFFDSFKRFALMHWGLLLHIPFALFMVYVVGIAELKIENSEIISEGDPTLLAIFGGIFGAIWALWLLSTFFIAIHPRKRGIHDLVTKTRVSYRVLD